MRARIAEWLGLDPSGLSSLLVSQPAALGLGFVASVWLLLRAGRAQNMRQRDVAELLIAAYLGALVVGRSLDMLMWGRAFWTQPWRIADPWFGGASTLGGLIGATLGVVWYTRRRGFDTVRFLDSAAPVAGVTVALFKSGCFLAGCCFGARSDGALGLRFPASSLVYYYQVGLGLIDAHYHASLPVLPVQLLEAAWALLVAVLLWSLGSVLRRWPGLAFVLGAVLLLVGRLAIESLRGAAVAGALGLSMGQLTCLAGLLALGSLAMPSWRRRLVRWLSAHPVVPAAGAHHPGEGEATPQA
jgi:phosphatidylglycerol:prolipoprotein diacylglycerol transferase